jgi:GLPGLI family protein
VKKSEPIDELVFRAQYELKMVEDTTKADRQPNSETMMLEVGKKCSQFYSYTTYLRDSTLIADYANKVSQDVLQQHAKAYGNGRITYRIYKNYPTGKVTTLDRLATSNFRCEEKNEKPVWTLLPDTATILTYHCRKATGHFRGRSYTAWFTMEIPVSEGPWKLCGLPGLIIKAEDDRRHYSFECTGIEQFRGPKPLLFNGKGFESISRRDLNKVYERYAKDPVGFITSTAPNVKLTVKDEQGNTLKNFELPYNPIELSEK